MKRSVLPISIAAAVLVLSAACSADAGATSSETPSAAPSASQNAEPPLDDCYGTNVTFDGPPNTIDHLSRYSDRVVMAEVKGVESAIFNTRDQKRPTKRPGEGYDPMVYTPYILQVTQTVDGAAEPGEIRAVARGGEVDCLVFTVYPSFVVERDHTYVFFLQPSPDAEGARHPELPLILAAWPVDAEGNVETEHDGVISVEAVSDAILASNN